MTTFASYNSFTNMQAEEDFMEVSNDPDRKNAMAMEEDNFDIDLDLGDGPQDGHDEDSMMDDGLLGQDGDQDYQMDDEYQEQGDQDDEILDYVEEEDDILEVPMTEEAAVQPQDATATTSNLFNTDAVPETPAFPSFTPQQSITGAISQDHGIQLQAQSAESRPAEPAQSLLAVSDDQTENLESVRTLYENETPALESHTLTEPQPSAEAPASKDPAATTKEPVVDAELNPDQTEQEPDQEEHAAPLPREEPHEAPHTSESQSHLHVAPALPSKAEVAQNPSEILPAPESKSDDQGPTEGNPDQSAAPAPAEQESTLEEPVPEAEPVHPVIVTYLDQQMSLFPPMTEEDGTPETYLLPDSSVFDQPIDAFLDICHSPLGLEAHEEVEVFFPSFHFTVHKYAPEAKQYTLRHIAELCIQFQQNDGIEHTEPLKIQLNVVHTLAGRMSYLYDLVSEHKSLSYVTSLLAPGDDAGFDDNDPTVDALTAGNDADGTGLVVDDGEAHDLAESADVHDEYHNDEPEDQGQDWHDEEDFEAQEEINYADATETSADDVHNNDTHADAELNESLDSAEAQLEDTGDNSTDQVSSQRNETEPEHQAAAPDAGEAPEDENEEVDVTQLGEDVQTAEEIDFEDDEWENEEPTNTDKIEAADAQQTTFDPSIEPSQSLHSATEPDANAQSQQRPDEAKGHPANENQDRAEAQSDKSGSSSATLQAVDNTQPLVAADDVDEEDIFGDDDDYVGVDEINDQGDLGDELDLGFDDEKAKSPSLKRIRSEVDGDGDEAGDSEGQSLKRSRSG